MPSLLPSLLWKHHIRRCILLISVTFLATGCQITEQNRPLSRAEELTDHLARNKGTLLAQVPVEKHSLVFYETTDWYTCEESTISSGHVAQFKGNDPTREKIVVIDDAGTLIPYQKRVFCIVIRDQILVSQINQVEIDFSDGTTIRATPQGQRGMIILVENTHGDPSFIRFHDTNGQVVSQTTCQPNCQWGPDDLSE